MSEEIREIIEHRKSMGAPCSEIELRILGALDDMDAPLTTLENQTALVAQAKKIIESEEG